MKIDKPKKRHDPDFDRQAHEPPYYSRDLNDRADDASAVRATDIDAIEQETYDHIVHAMKNKQNPDLEVVAKSEDNSDKSSPDGALFKNDDDSSRPNPHKPVHPGTDEGAE
jgi:hypothetical protein